MTEDERPKKKAKTTRAEAEERERMTQERREADAEARKLEVEARKSSKANSEVHREREEAYRAATLDSIYRVECTLTGIGEQLQLLNSILLRHFGMDENEETSVGGMEDSDLSESEDEAEVGKIGKDAEDEDMDRNEGSNTMA